MQVRGKKREPERMGRGRRREGEKHAARGSWLLEGGARTVLRLSAAGGPASPASRAHASLRRAQVALLRPPYLRASPVSCSAIGSLAASPVASVTQTSSRAEPLSRPSLPFRVARAASRAKFDAFLPRADIDIGEKVRDASSPFLPDLPSGSRAFAFRRGARRACVISPIFGRADPPDNVASSRSVLTSEPARK